MSDARPRAAAIFFLIAGGIAILQLAFALDPFVYAWLARPIASGQVKAVLVSLRSWGEGPTIVLLAAGLACVSPKRWREIVAMVLVAALCSMAVDTIKHVTARARPFETPNPLEATFTPSPNPRNSSFPSGHTATAFAFARCLVFFCPAVWPAALAGAFGTALSRMYEQRHWFSDCVVGAAIGWFLAGWLWRRAATWTRAGQKDGSGADDREAADEETTPAVVRYAPVNLAA